jgi:hypothetical protein
MLDVFDMFILPFGHLSRIITPFLAIMFALCISEIKYMFISLVLQKSATNDIMSLIYQYFTLLERKFTHTKVIAFMEGWN